jgi:alpha-1,3-rhamnosyl/mannosyltransferase
MLRVAVNAVALLSPFAGVAAYIRNLMSALAASGEVRPRYFYGARWSDQLLSRVPSGVATARKLLRSWLPLSWELSRYVQRAAFAAEVRQGKFDLYHEPNYLLLSERLPAVVTVHDLSFVHYPETHPAGRVRVVNRRLPRSLNIARAVITDSFAVREEIIRHYQVPAEKVHAVHLGVSPLFRPRESAALSPLLRRFELQQDRYLLSVGTLEPRKNLVRVLRAFAQLPATLRDRFPLVVVGAAGWRDAPIFAELGPLERNRQVRVLGYVDDQTVAALYAGARAVVYASLYEGFGLPIVEAMASGAPVLTSNIGCMKEVGENAALLVDPHDTEAVAGGMRRLLEDNAERERLRAAAIARAGDFSWDRCARETLAVYRRVLSR